MQSDVTKTNYLPDISYSFPQSKIREEHLQKVLKVISEWLNKIIGTT